MHFADSREHAIPFFVATNTMPINMIYCESIAKLMYDVSNKYAPINIINLFTKSGSVHSYNSRSAAADNFYVEHSRLELQKQSFSRAGVRLWNNVPVRLRNLRKTVFKKELHQIFISILKEENAYNDIPAIIHRIADYQSFRTN